MRFLLHEQGYEKPVAAGRLIYEQNGQPTGAVESWRLTDAAAGYRFLRVDVDGRAAASGNSSLFHLTLNPQGQPEQLKFRFFGPRQQVKGSVLFEGATLAIAREVNGQGRQEEMLTANHFWFPATLSLGLLAGLAGEGQVEAVMLDAAAQFTPRLVTLHYHEGQPEMVEVMGKQWQTRPLTLTWADQTRTLWLDAHHQPLLMARQDGLRGRETRYIRYKS
jgi:hypothetical protein